MTVTVLTYLYCYSSRTFEIRYTGTHVEVLKPNGDLVESVQASASNPEIVRDVFNTLKTRYIFDHDKELTA